ncbi:hypothetical protein HELRODRAFT_174805 [Helobdella robusta]|uniref:Lysosomal-associated transmembrane protein 4A n=1 Tax=Helobdella robusta TaxID=6412 RepID=T1F8I0_HELRO|nr:hypothetical protein HELRODRAFT_174805 [Helobdella robusta]ESO01258.1 hypothetical protein HELRODRAFT_174805 [Helobdella robusta]
MRWKFYSSISDEYRCCGCVHVKTATCFIGGFIVGMQLVFLIPLLLLASSNDQKLLNNNNKMITNNESWKPDVNVIPGTTSLATPLSSSPTSTTLWWKKQSKSLDESGDLFGSILFFGSCIIITVMLIYGTLVNKPGYLTPFMGLQVFDFCISSLNLISYFTYADDLKVWIKKNGNLPYKDKLENLQPDMLVGLFVLISISVLCLKVYIMGIVWSCYKYLSQQVAINNNNNDDVGVVIRRPNNNNDDVESAVTDGDGLRVAEIMLPPKYEDINNFFPAPPPLPADYTFPPPPPPYSQITTNTATTAATSSTTTVAIAATSTNNNNN